MPRRRDPVPRARAAGHWLGGILLLGLLGGGVVVAAMLLWENLDVRQLAPGIATDPGPLPDPAPALSPGVQGGSFQAVLLRTPPNEGFYPDTTYYQRALEHWRRLIQETGGVVREVVSAADLRSLTVEDLLVVPESPCLSREEVAAVLAHLRSGGGVVSNWAVGARDESCEWRGWGTVADLTGAGDVRELANREALFLTVPGGMALSPGLDPGARIELRPDPSLALNLPGPRIYWSDWALNPAPDESGGGADVAALTARDESGGRMTWFGFRLAQAATPRDSVRLDRLVRNGLLWASGRGSASVAAWPDGKRAALLLVEDVEAEQRNALAMAEVLDELDIPGSFYAVSQLTVGDQELGEALLAVGEVGSQTSDHNPVAGLSFQDQAVRLRRSWSEIQEWTSVPPAGLRPPEESFDSNTLRAWADAGGSYVLAVNQARSASPEIHSFRNREPMVLLPRLLKDDYNVFVQEGAIRTEHLSAAFLEGMEKLRALGGVAVVAVHTQIIGTGRRLDAVRDVADRAMEEGGWWIGTGKEVAEWWRARSEIQVTGSAPEIAHSAGSPEPDSEPAGLTAASVDSAGPDPSPDPILELQVTGPEDRALDGVWIDVVLPKGPEGAIPVVDGVPVSYTRTEWGVRVPLGALASGVAKVLSIVPVSGEPSSRDGR